ncbi:ubiquitin carboxyl-terminal hydrolase 23-like [Ananas comosus]|uniref:Ubiquitin carboxyl-terminal hydrolase n=1 Tax=Ananas comosus TaxID=4615 RepID=A0A6P5GRG8_ANACO|nr:ubiquitin carboxyl-terminal hydrolase 23-like [Ananas comosus]
MAEDSSAADAAVVAAPAPTVESLFGRRIEFHPARKPSSATAAAASGAIGGGGFRLETLNPGADQRRGPAGPAGPAGAPATAAGKRSEGGEFYEHGLDPELGFRITFRRIGAGLANLGNTCFLNSVLQCLTYTEPFAAYLQSGKHKSSCRTAGFCAMCALQNHVMHALQSTGKILSPSHLVKNLRCISRNFRNFRQEDAHEYMINLLESMHKCCLPSGVPSESPSAYERSLVYKIFGGRLRSQVKCMQCSYCSNTFDPFLDLSLEIAKADSLHKALKHFTGLEQLDGGERQYQCQRCKQKVRAYKQLTINKAPFVLTIHLKRFDSHIAGQKIDRKVEFEPRIDLKPFVSDPNEGDLKYTLYGVLVHAGWNTHSGHYYCFVRTSSGMWHSLDDNQVHQVSEKTVLSQKAYMLFYVRDRSLIVNSSKHPHCENLQFRLITDSNVQTVENGNQSNGNSTSDQLLDETKRKIGVTLGTSEQPKICLNHAPDQCKSSKTDSHDKGTHQHELVSLLTRGLAETTVARWDDIELPMTENLHRVESSVKKSIGYVLDEWDEEYDRGKRKKVKNGKESFDGANPFQDVASMKARKKMKLKVDQTRVGNQPLRIL